VTDDEAYNELLAGLAQARKIAAGSNPGSRFRGFIKAVMSVDIYLGKRGAPPETREILGTLRNILFDARRKVERGSGAGGLKPVGETQRMALAAAIVTELMRRKVPSTEAIAKVATSGGIDKKKLRDFRDNINRGLKDRDTLKFYNLYVTTFAGKSTTEAVMLELLKHPH
jgi:hypothetical protein